jgi:hypothetical protein
MTLKEFKIYPQEILFSRKNILEFTKLEYGILTLSRESTHLFDLPYHIYDRKDRFKKKIFKKGVGISEVSKKNIKGKIYVISMEHFLKNMKLNSQLYQTFLHNLEVTKVLVLSNKVFNDEGIQEFSSNCK